MYINYQILTPDEFLAVTKMNSDMWIWYCEILIFPDGNISLARPSHTETVFSYYEKKNHITRDEINKEIPEYCSPLHYIIEKENLVSVWYQFIICSENITPKQEKTLKFLVNHELISDKYARTYSHEYSLALSRQNIEKETWVIAWVFFLKRLSLRFF